MRNGTVKNFVETMDMNQTMFVQIDKLDIFSMKFSWSPKIINEIRDIIYELYKQKWNEK